MTTRTLSVPDISCEHCEHAITQALKEGFGQNDIVTAVLEGQVIE